MTTTEVDISWFVYLVSAVSFVIGLHLMNSPRTARRGNLVSAGGMFLAVLTAIVGAVVDGFTGSLGVVVLAIGLTIGAVVGALAGRKVEMTAMPQLVSLFNMVGGGAAALIAANEVIAGKLLSVSTTATTALGILIGCVTFTGSFVAAGKLQGFISGNPIRLPLHRLLEVAVAAVSIGAIGWLVHSPTSIAALLVLAAASLSTGLLVVLPIGGADMPVVISLLNACTGTAVAMAGFSLGNLIMIVAGALVGSAGAILSVLMGKAMNRSILSIVVGGFGTADAASGSVSGAAGSSVRQTTADDVAIQLAYAHKVVIVPGYGLAAARAQHELADVGALLESRGVDVTYAIHPVAGRMPGQMNVLLAEANVPYSQLEDMDESNPTFAEADVALVVGANDVTNPAARRPGTPISGMPILDVDKAASIIVLKRSMGHGYAGIDNELYGNPKTSMLFGDAKQSLTSLLAAVKTLVA